MINSSEIRKVHYLNTNCELIFMDRFQIIDSISLFIVDAKTFENRSKCFKPFEKTSEIIFFLRNACRSLCSWESCSNRTKESTVCIIWRSAVQMNQYLVLSFPFISVYFRFLTKKATDLSALTTMAVELRSRLI